MIVKKKPYLQIEKMNALIKAARSEKRSQFINETGKYADFILGTNWRNENLITFSGSHLVG
jgi:hypothetical protein